VAENMEKKREEAARRINTVHHLENASKAFRQAEGLVRANRHAIAIEQLKAVRDTYADTPYGDMAIVYLRQLEPPAEPTDPE
jgi:hypothetical protein